MREDLGMPSHMPEDGLQFKFKCCERPLLPLDNDMMQGTPPGGSNLACLGMVYLTAKLRLYPYLGLSC